MKNNLLAFWISFPINLCIIIALALLNINIPFPWNIVFWGVAGAVAHQGWYILLNKIRPGGRYEFI